MAAINSNNLYTDFNSLSLLKKEAKLNPESDATLREVAQQFESLFLHMMLKSMRSAVSESELISSDQTNFYQEMLDEQLSTELPKQGGIGLADIIVKQLGGQGKYDGVSQYSDEILRSPINASNITSLLKRENTVGAAEGLDADAKYNATNRAQFVQDIIPSINSAAQSLGVKRDAILAQAILETGWGESIIHDSQGQSSHNLFGIKANDEWQGERITTKTYEFIDGSLRPRHEDFRAYQSYDESIKDYVNFISNGERYQEALKHGDNVGAYAEKIQQAGYATDPAYAEKVKNIIAGDTYKSLLSSAESEFR
ncbi:MAG: flagellar assembly peptidoglycan hydrolase FlgJ [Gammaproteobacteria bacterium]|nr:flagellar assembly peptidoglycan hydrolase FlgJ [Gammaproteobacteria bacterium]PCH62678.1 MAG: flagellar assembly peptidoglycan hydrolase FlgJ [Gammaproteobacteria bacterium]